MAGEAVASSMFFVARMLQGPNRCFFDRVRLEVFAGKCRKTTCYGRKVKQTARLGQI